MKKFLRENALAIVFFAMFLLSLLFQVVFGIEEYNTELAEEGGTTASLAEYLSSGHFFQSTFENWESEVLQMGLFVWFTIFLRQRGSSESKSFDAEDAVDREPTARRKKVPWPVKKGGLILKVYENSLTISLFLLFIVSFLLHFFGSLADENLHRSLKGEPLQTAGQYIAGSRLWFESFQNWQSEFLSVFAIITLSIYLRQKGSPQSKPVDAPHDETGS